MKFKIFTILLSSCILSSLAQTRYFVNISKGSDSNNGLSWSTSFKNLQPALNKAKANDEIWISEGTYIPTQKMIETDHEGNPTSNRYKTFIIPRGVALYGGFPIHSDENTGLNNRDWETYKTILSGDLNEDDDDSFTLMEENAFHVVVLLNTGDSTTLDGFVIYGGNANGTDNTVIDQTSILNHTGGGIYAYANGKSLSNSSPILQNLIIANNISTNAGGGIYCHSETGKSSPKISFSEIIENKSTEGGGVFLEGKKEASPIINNCTISGNEALEIGGGIYCKAEDTGGSPIINNTLISGNRATNAGGLYCFTYLGDIKPVLTNVTLCGNLASKEGGGMFCKAYLGVSIPELRNTIIWGNDATTHKNICNKDNFESKPLIYNSHIEGIQTTKPEFKTAVEASFSPTTDGDYHLNDNSTLINKGNNSFITESLKDLDGKTRIIDTTVDIGAYEVQDPSTVYTQEIDTEDQIWTYPGRLHVKVNQPTNIRIYTPDGVLIKQVQRITEGTAVITLPQGFYLISLNDHETSEKVYVPNN